MARKIKNDNIKSLFWENENGGYDYIDEGVKNVSSNRPELDRNQRNELAGNDEQNLGLHSIRTEEQHTNSNEGNLFGDDEVLGNADERERNRTDNVFGSVDTQGSRNAKPSERTNTDRHKSNETNTNNDFRTSQFHNQLQSDTYNGNSNDTSLFDEPTNRPVDTKTTIGNSTIHRPTTNGNVEIAGNSKVKPQVTYCLVNGARKLNGTCNNSKYSAGSAKADYFITNAAIHVINGEVKLSYYNDGSKVYEKIASFVADAKNYDKNAYNTNGLTKSVSYSISPKVSEWGKVNDKLYKSKNKFVRTKSGSITDVKYTITGAPSGLTVGEIKVDANKIDSVSDLKNYDICVAQTDASNASSNFVMYCNQKALDKINKVGATIKVNAQAYANENGGRKWTPTVVSQQKITFLEEFTNAF